MYNVLFFQVAVSHAKPPSADREQSFPVVAERQGTNSGDVVERMKAACSSGRTQTTLPTATRVLSGLNAAHVTQPPSPRLTSSWPLLTSQIAMPFRPEPMNRFPSGAKKSLHPSLRAGALTGAHQRAAFRPEIESHKTIVSSITWVATIFPSGLNAVQTSVAGSSILRVLIPVCVSQTLTWKRYEAVATSLPSPLNSTEWIGSGCPVWTTISGRSFLRQ